MNSPKQPVTTLSAVADTMQNLRDTIIEASDLLGELKSSLSPILVPETGDTPESLRPELDNPSPLMSEIYEMQRRVMSLSQSIRDIANRKTI
jgi:hypothetical protein